MSRLFSLALGLPVMLILTCDHKSTEPTTIPLDSVALELGMRWNYIIELISDGDSIYQDSTIAYLVRTVIADTVIEGIDMKVVDDTLQNIDTAGNSISIQRYWLSLDQSHLVRHGIDYNAADSLPPSFSTTPYVLLDFPITWGKLWANPPSGMFGDTIRVIGYEKISAAGEEHRCWVVETIPSPYNPFPNRSHDWYSEIGLVKSETLLEGTRKQWILVDYFPSSY